MCYLKLNCNIYLFLQFVSVAATHFCFNLFLVYFSRCCISKSLPPPPPPPPCSQFFAYNIAFMAFHYFAYYNFDIEYSNMGKECKNVCRAIFHNYFKSAAYFFHAFIYFGATVKRMHYNQSCEQISFESNSCTINVT